MVMSVGERDNDFWEKTSIELDIAIDEQDEEKYEKIVKGPINYDWAEFLKKDRNEFWKEADKLLRDFIATKKIFEGDKHIELSQKRRGNGQDNSDYNFWTSFFVAKKIRAKLQSANTDTQSTKLDWVVDILIKKAASVISEENPFQYLLLMFELAACTVGEQSLGFSEKAKEILDLNCFSEEKKHAYKALIHYNQGIAKAHMHQLDEALKPKFPPKL